MPKTAPKKSLKSKLQTLASTVPHLTVNALAGTGKTTTMVEGLKVLRGLSPGIDPSPQQRAIWDQLTLSKDAKTITFTSFSKAIVTELEQRVPKECRTQTMTMHSMGLRVVQSVYGRVKPTGWRTSNLIAQAYDKDLRKLKKDIPETIQAVSKLVSLAKQNLASSDEYDHICGYYGIELNGNRAEVYDIADQVLELSKDVSRDMECHFDDMIWLPVVLGLSVPRQDLLIVDEAQDLNRVQQALALKAGKRLILVGDPQQAIYGFAGADSESMPRMFRTLSETDVGCKELGLTTTYRCGKAIVERAKQFVPNFEAHESNPEGKISQGRFEVAEDGPACKRCEGSGRVTPNKKKDAEEDGLSECKACDGTGKVFCGNYRSKVEDGDMVLCRCNAPLVSECFKFLKAGRKAQIQGRNVGSNLVSVVKKLVKQSGKDFQPGDRETPIVDLVERLDLWTEGEIEKEQVKKNPDENKIISLQDKSDCLILFSERAQTAGDVIDKIESIFSDDKTTGIRLSSIHKAKGLEASRVFLLLPKDAPCPHPMAKTPQAMEQEMNLLYVATTRAINELIYVS